MSYVLPEYQREWRAKNLEHSRAYMREYMRNYAFSPEQKLKIAERGKRRQRKLREDPVKLDNYRKSERKRARGQIGSVAYARALLERSTGVDRAHIPDDLAEAKATQLRAARLIREMSGKKPAGRRRMNDDGAANLPSAGNTKLD